MVLGNPFYRFMTPDAGRTLAGETAAAKNKWNQK